MSGSAIAVLFFVWLLLAIVVGIDASVNSSQSGFLWGLAVLIGGIFGVLIYYLVGRDRANRDGKRDRDDRADRRGGRPSHICRSCEERYFTASSSEINTCRKCGGIKVVTASEYFRSR